MKHQLFAVFLLISHICPAQLIIEMTIARNENTLTFRQQQAPRPTGDRLVVNKPRNLFIVNNQTLDSGYRVVIVSDANQIPRFSIKIPESEIRASTKDSFEFDNLGNFSAPVVASGSMVFPAKVHLRKTNSGQITNLKTWTLDTTDASGAKPIMNVPKRSPAATGGETEGTTLTGIAIYDAKSLFSPGSLNVDDIIKILQFYNSSDVSDISAVLEAYRTNPFLREYVAELLASKGELQSGGALSFLTSPLSAIGGLDVTNISDGLAKFLVKRAKEELNLAFFEKFKQTLLDPRYRDLPTLFPQTVSLLNTIGEEVYNYDRYLQNLRESFKTDLKELHVNLPGIIDNHPRFFARYPVAKASLRTACYVAQALEDQSHPGDILANYPLEWLDTLGTDPDPANKNGLDLKGAIQTLQVISASVRDTASSDDSGYWVSLSQIRDLVNNKILFKIYLGLIYQQAATTYSGIPFKSGRLTQFLDTIASHYDQRFAEYDACRKYVLRFGEKAHMIKTMITAHEKPANDSSAFELYAKYFKASVELIEYSTRAAELPVIRDVLPNFHPRFHAYFDVAYAATDLVVEIVRKNYSAAINQAVHIYDVVKSRPLIFNSSNGIQPSLLTTGTATSTASQKQILIQYQAALDTFRQQHGGTLSDADKAVFERTFWTNDRIQSVSQRSGQLLIKYGAFVSSVAVAKNSDEIANAIEAFALPSGSARIKRVSDFNVSINAYLGLFAGFERIKGADDNNFKINTYGITAPLGVAASWGHRPFYGFGSGGKWSYSVFLSLIDVGTVAAFRFKDTISKSGNEVIVADKVPTIQLRDIFSPGLFLSAGIPNSPISLNLGAQAGPNLRKITSVSGGMSNSKDLANKIYWRYSLSVVVDIPVFNLYTRSN